ncbi:MAG: sulfatase-like hydrolase/transferase [Bacteroidales bacterium]|nr:sulfatase-like hydrolase/transferase [Bacteroidales bacterium]
MKTKLQLSPITTLLLRGGCLMLMYTLLRIIFYLYNRSYFSTADFSCFLYGLRFDLCALAYINALYAILVILPIDLVFTKTYRKITNIIFILFNTIPLITAFIDIGYFPYSLRRSTSAIFTFVEGTNNMGQLIPQFLHDFWSVAVLFLLFAILVFFITQWFDYSIERRFKYDVKNVCKLFFSRILIIALFVISCRGGFQLRPINNVTAGHYAAIEDVPVVLNTPFSIITTLGRPSVTLKDYLPENQLDNYFTPIKRTSANNRLDMPEFKNIVIIIMEGISSEYSNYLAQEPKNVAGFTPFLDSLAKQSITFTGYANGQQSIVALPAVLGGIPSLSESSFTQSYYATNRIHYPVRVLTHIGYDCSFYHGGANGTMGFDKFCLLAGMDEYNGLDEYPNKKDYDGHWGIFDEPYLQYVADELNQKKSPFLTCIYTLSSHHPYTVPEKYQNVLPKGEFPMQQTVAYTDMALREFFAKVSKMDWYKQTLFVITSDHTNFAESKHNHTGQLYNIPLIFFHPLNTNPQRIGVIAQQTDIMPSILGLLQVDEPFVSYGNNLFDTTQTRFAVHYKEPFYEMKIDNVDVSFDGNSSWQFFPDTISNKEYYQNFLKAYIQQYDNRMIKNDFIDARPTK